MCNNQPRFKNNHVKALLRQPVKIPLIERPGRGIALVNSA
ncbi:MAG: hypothetical protein JWP78_1002 [Mucilaginibacter sp.]|nr:hypothetical protein [Mucilaginibacter sp.]